MDTDKLDKEKQKAILETIVRRVQAIAPQPVPEVQAPNARPLTDQEKAVQEQQRIWEIDATYRSLPSF